MSNVAPPPKPKCTWNAQGSGYGGSENGRVMASVGKAAGFTGCMAGEAHHELLGIMCMVLRQVGLEKRACWGGVVTRARSWGTADLEGGVGGGGR